MASNKTHYQVVDSTPALLERQLLILATPRNLKGLGC